MLAREKCNACVRYYSKIREESEVAAECKAECPRAGRYRKPHNGRRTVIHQRDGDRQFVVRRPNGQFRDVQSIRLAAQRDQRRTRLATADRRR